MSQSVGFLTIEVVRDLEVLNSLNAETNQQFIDLAVQSIKHGSADNDRKYRKAARALGLEPSSIIALISSISFVLCQATSHKMNTADLETALTSKAALSTEAAQLISAALEAARSAIDSALVAYSLHQLPCRYSSFGWRLQVQLASRALLRTNQTSYLIELKTETDGVVQSQLLTTDLNTMKHLEAELENAIKAAQSKASRKLLRRLK